MNVYTVNLDKSSQSLGNKIDMPHIFSINEIRPKEKFERKDNEIIILGSNFGAQPGTVWIEHYLPTDVKVLNVESLKPLSNQDEYNIETAVNEEQRTSKIKELKKSRPKIKYVYEYNPDDIDGERYQPKTISWKDIE